MGKKSILGYMIDQLNDGNLPADFKLPRIDDGNDIKFADGAMDGMCFYHMQPMEMNDEVMKAIDHTMRTAAGNPDLAEKSFAELGKKYRIIKIIDGLQRYTSEHTEEFDAGVIYRFAVHLVIDSDDRECVKAGLAILELYNLPEELKYYIRILGLSDEFTVFVAFLMRNWENGNMELLELGRRVYGWGRIQIVFYIEPENQEIKEWLLMEGVKNKVLSAYSGWMCYEKAGVENLLMQTDLPYDKFHAICLIVKALLDEGPVAGISNIENADQMLVKFLQHAVKFMPLSAEDSAVIGQISNWQKETGVENPAMADLINQLSR